MAKAAANQPAKGEPVTSPYIWDCADSQGRVIRATFNFSEATGHLASCRVERDTGCSYGRILIGVGPDGTPDTTVSLVDARGQGVVTLTPPQMADIGLHTIDDLLNTQITAGV